MNIIVSLIFIALGVHLVAKTESWLSGFGRIAFFEKHFGLDGGSRLGYKLLGILIIFFGMLIMTGMFSGFILFFLEPLLKYNR
ncbi:hypothetical protein ISS03_04110 [Patescibacteria group bacterium]|nr:hypothetical protein [Patescibacteria group bacterium]